MVCLVDHHTSYAYSSLRGVPELEAPHLYKWAYLLKHSGLSSGIRAQERARWARYRFNCDKSGYTVAHDKNTALDTPEHMLFVASLAQRRLDMIHYERPIN